jgi:hypothetical protein
MPRTTNVPAATLREIERLLMSGLTYEEVAPEVGMTRSQVIEASRATGICARVRNVRVRALIAAQAEAVRAALEDHPDRPARPAGHRSTWGLLWDGLMSKPGPYETYPMGSNVPHYRNAAADDRELNRRGPQFTGLARRNMLVLSEPLGVAA